MHLGHLLFWLDGLGTASSHLFLWWQSSSLTPAPGDHDGWEKVMACCSCCPVAGTRVGDRFASGAGIGRDGRPPPVSEDSLLVLRADFGVRGGMPRPVGKALSRRITVAIAQARAMAGANGHVSPRGPSPD